MALSKELVNRFLEVDPATVGHYISGGFMRPEMKSLKRNKKRMIGPAYTVRISGRDSYALYYAISKAEKGSVIVVDRCGDNTFACCGEMLATYAKGCEMAGIVIDGPVTDSMELEELDFPIYCTGISVVTTTLIGVSGEIDIAITCSGTAVNPGDLVFANADGVIVLPKDNYEYALKQAEESVSEELSQREIFAQGKLPNWDLEKLFKTDTLSILRDIRNKK